MKLFDSITAAFKKKISLFTDIHTNTIIRLSSRITILLICCSLAVLIFSWNKLPLEVPLWYSKPWGEDRLADPSWLFLLPGASLFWYLINSLLTINITKDHLVFSQILFLSALLVSIFSFVTLSMIIWIIS